MTATPLSRILLIDRHPYAHREGVLRAGNFDVKTVSSLEEAQRAITPGQFDLILVVTDALDGDPEAFCQNLKSEDPTQLVALLTGPHVYYPSDSCPDEIIENTGGPRALIQRVASIIYPEPETSFAD